MGLGPRDLRESAYYRRFVQPNIRPRISGHSGDADDGPAAATDIWGPERYAHDCVRHGTRSLSSTLNVATGEVIGQCSHRHQASGFLRFMNEVDKALPKGDEVEVEIVLDNASTLKTKQGREVCGGSLTASPPNSP